MDRDAVGLIVGEFDKRLKALLEKMKEDGLLASWPLGKVATVVFGFGLEMDGKLVCDAGGAMEQLMPMAECATRYIALYETLLRTGELCVGHGTIRLLTTGPAPSLEDLNQTIDALIEAKVKGMSSPDRPH